MDPDLLMGESLRPSICDIGWWQLLGTAATPQVQYQVWNGAAQDTQISFRPWLLKEWLQQSAAWEEVCIGANTRRRRKREFS